MSRFKGKIESALSNGEGTFAVEEEGITCSMLFDEEAIAYSEIDAFRFENYSVYVSAAGRHYRFFHMGQQNEWMYLELYAAYNKKVLHALLTEGEPILAAEGVCTYEGIQERAKILVFEDCLCVLPQGKPGRRFPFVCMNGLSRAGYSLTITLTTGETCTFSMLGQDLDPLERDITKQVRASRENNRAFILDICPQLSYTDTAATARLFQEGMAAPLSKVGNALQKVLLAKAHNSKMGPYLDTLLALGEKDLLAIGIKALDPETVDTLKAALLEKLNANAQEEVTLTPQQEDALKWMVWAAIPTVDRQYAIVDFAFPQEDAATYLFRLEEPFEAFLPLLNRALEATKMTREIFSAPEAKLSANMRMLLTRTPAAEKLRECYVGKAIHRSPVAWAKSITALAVPKLPSHTARCIQCGSKVEEGMHFCGKCGAKLLPPSAGLCPACGTSNPPSSRFCGRCGTRL